MGRSPFLNHIRQEIRLRGYSLRTEKTYLHWIKRYIYFHRLKHPEQMGTQEVRAFLTWLSNEKHVSINTQKTALNALAFLYHKVLNIDLGDLDFQRAKQYRRLPIVLTPSEVTLILAQLDERNQLIFSLLYGSGLRITECLRLRVQDIDFTDNSLTVRDGKGNKDRKTVLGKRLHQPLQTQIQQALSFRSWIIIKAMGRRFQTHLEENIQMLSVSPLGCSCSHPVDSAITPLLERSVGITLMIPCLERR